MVCLCRQLKNVYQVSFIRPDVLYKLHKACVQYIFISVGITSHPTVMRSIKLSSWWSLMVSDTNPSRRECDRLPGAYKTALCIPLFNVSSREKGREEKEYHGWNVKSNNVEVRRTTYTQLLKCGKLIVNS